MSKNHEKPQVKKPIQNLSANRLGPWPAFIKLATSDRDAISATGQVGGQVGGMLDPISQDFLHQSCVFVCLGHLWEVSCGFF